jgi:hypothetical protein
VIVTDDDVHGEDSDPLLVRPFLLIGSDSHAAEPSAQTWPSATTREVRSHRALEGADDPTAILELPPGPAGPSERHVARRRLLVVAAAGGAVLLGGTAAGVAALRPDHDRPPATATLQDPPPLATGGPLPGTPSPVATASATASRSAPASASRSAPASSASASASASAGADASSTPGGATVISPTAENRETTSPPAGFAPELPAARVGPIRGQNNLCLDLSGGVAVEGNHIQVFHCNSSVAQQWTLATDGTMRVSGMCALVAGDNTVHTTTCDGRTTAQWSISGQRLISAANARCLTDPSSGAFSATPVRVTTCNGAANQRWSLP